MKLNRRLSCRLTVVLSTCLALLAFTGNANAQATITDLSASEATIGTEFTITGTGFGTSKPKVALSEGGEAVKKTTLKVLSNSDTSITVSVSKAFAGTFNVLVTPKSQAPVESMDTIDIVGPSVDDVEAGVFAPGQQATMMVEYASTKATVTVGGLKAKVVSIEPVDTAGDGEPQDISTVTFEVPKKIANGEWAVAYSNGVGADIGSTGLSVSGSDADLGKVTITCSVNGGKAVKATPDVDASLAGPTIVRGEKKSSRIILELPFVLGTDAAPQTYSEGPAAIRFEDTSTGDVYASADDEFLILVSAAEGTLVAGAFGGTLYPLAEGGLPPIDVVGTFVYDGSYPLTDTGGDTETILIPGQTAPPIEIQVLSVEGATGPFSNFQPGDMMAVTFRLAKDDGTSWHIDEFSRGRAMISGPTFNYQRVVTSQTDVRAVAVDNGDGTYTYTFPPLPDVYLPPYNDTPDFDEDDGELQGLPLLDGTYTAAIWFEWTYSVSGRNYGEVGTRLIEFIVGATPLLPEPRQVVTTENCNQCHVDLEFHGGHRKMNEMCVLCHTAGAEDRNVPSAGGGTPGASIEMSVMVHKIHNGAHLPSVLGVTTNMDGTRKYDATPKPYQLVGFGNSIHDYGEVEFPAWPNLNFPMPRDSGYDALADNEQDLEDTMRAGVTSCYLCHGDPDGDEGPLVAPEQGDFAYDVQRRNTCGSCHDDWVIDNLYTSNMQTMPIQFDDDTCTACHDDNGSNLDPRAAHLHPLLDPTFATGVNFDIETVEVPGAEGVSNPEPGDKLAITFTITDDMGTDIDPADLDRHNVMVSGPTWNNQTLTPEIAIPAEVLTGAQPYTMNIPERVYFEEIGVATAGADEFMTSRTPHWNVGGQLTEVFEVTGISGASDQTDGEVETPVNYIDVDDASGFDRDQYVAIDFGGGDQEFLQIQSVIDDRLWFSSPYTTGYAPGPLNDHADGVDVDQADVTALIEGVDYSIDEAFGTITEIGTQWTDGAIIIVTYTTDWVIPDTYPLALNAGPDLTESDGGWAGKSFVDGTYSVGMWGHIERDLGPLFGETTAYDDGGDGDRVEFLAGPTADELEPYDNITTLDNCYACHVDISFHGNNRLGWNSCLMCHGNAATGDRPQYVAPNAPATDGVTVNFREMLHKIHAGADLYNADTYTVVGFGLPFLYPNNFSTHGYEAVHFPAMPSGVQDCATCHGETSIAWTEPDDRGHPTEQDTGVQEWTIVCGSCHDSPEVQAHIETQSSPTTGIEACSLCHGEDQTWNVDLMHVVR